MEVTYKEQAGFGSPSSPEELEACPSKWSYSGVGKRRTARDFIFESKEKWAQVVLFFINNG